MARRLRVQFPSAIRARRGIRRDWTGTSESRTDPVGSALTPLDRPPITTRPTPSVCANTTKACPRNFARKESSPTSHGCTTSSWTSASN